MDSQLCNGMQQELAELTDSVPWKWWAKYQEFDKQNAKVRSWIYFTLISLAQVMGMTADDVHEAYLKKNKVNHDRQERDIPQRTRTTSSHLKSKEKKLLKSGGKAGTSAAQRAFPATLFDEPIYPYRLCPMRDQRLAAVEASSRSFP